ncbi:MAG: glycosyltransferase family 2 protein [Bdellovibrio sp.]|nr:glycosyltransferase family 2 protein [Methylotenera sp.]
MSGISILILTKNEQQDLPDCLASVMWSNDIHLLDSESTDDTTKLAQALGVKVTVRAFDGYASQRNAGLKLPYKHDWVLILDADERITPELAVEMQAFVATAPLNVAGARMRRRDIWWGRWLKHAQISPFYVRLVRVGRAHYEREINEVLVVDGDIVDLTQPFDHYPFSKGLDHWISKHNTYSRMEAEVIAKGALIKPSWRIGLFGHDFSERRIHQKAIFYSLPARPFIKFIYMLIARRAFLDGWPGIRYAILQAIYEYFIVLKTTEIYENKTKKKQIKI